MFELTKDEILELKRKSNERKRKNAERKSSKMAAILEQKRTRDARRYAKERSNRLRRCDIIPGIHSCGHGENCPHIEILLWAVYPGRSIIFDEETSEFSARAYFTYFSPRLNHQTEKTVEGFATEAIDAIERAKAQIPGNLRTVHLTNKPPVFYKDWRYLKEQEV